MSTAESIEPDELELAQLVDQLRQEASLEQVRGFLRSQLLEHSAGSWAEMHARLEKHISSGHLTIARLIAFSAEVSEYGHQHIFLFRALPTFHVPNIFDDEGVRSLSSRVGRRLVQGDDLDAHVASARINLTSVRLHEGTTRSISFKLEEERVRLINESVFSQNGRTTKSYDEIRFRAINIVRLHESGLLEVRVRSHEEAYDYARECTAIRSLLNWMLPPNSFVELSLIEVKAYFCDHNQHQHVSSNYGLRFGDHKTASGSRLRSSAGGLDSSMYDDAAIVASMQAVQEGASMVERVGITFKPNGPLQRSIFVVFTDEVNEFMIQSKLTSREYDYILDRVISLAQLS